MTMLFLLLVAHFIADFPLQGDFLAKHKAPRLWALHMGVNFERPGPHDTTPNPIWPWCMTAHCAIHAGFVGLITGSLWLALAEFWAHGIIDLRKCRGAITFGQDQALHIGCKVLWVVVLVLP